MAIKTSSATLTDLLFEKASVGLCLVAPDGTVVRANAEWLRSTGFTEEQVSGENIVDLFPATRDMALAMHARARAGHRVEVPRHAQVVNGRETWWEGSIEPVAMEGGAGLLITTREVARDGRLAEDLVHAGGGPDLIGPLLDTIGNLVVVLDKQGRVVRFNAACERATGYSASEVVGRTVFDMFVPFDDLTAVKAVFDQLRAGDFPNRHVNRWRAKDGAHRLIEWANTCVVDDRGDVVYVVGTGTDVTDRAASERALRDSEDGAQRRTAELEAVLDAVPAAVFITRDRDSRSMDANRFCAELLRVPRRSNVSKSAQHDAAPRSFRTMKDGVEILPEELPVQRAARGEHVRGYAFDLVFEDGEVRHLFGNATPLDTLGGGAVGAFLDITALRQREQQFRLLTEAMPQIVCVLAPDGTAEYVNGAWTRFSGLDAAATARAGLAGVVHPDDVAAALDCRRRVLKQLVPQDVELRYRAADGTYRWFLSRLAPVVANGRVVQLVGAGLDITERKVLEQQLRDADRRKTEFLGVLSHELRNPLAPIRNSIYVLERAAPGSEQAARASAVIRRQTEHLTRLVDDLLDVTRIARGKIELRRSRVELRELVSRVGEDFRWMLQDRGVRFDIAVPEQPLWVDADGTRVTQVIGNLLHNASKFTRRGDTVALSIAATDGAAEVRVRDTGAGIDPELLPRVFEAFVQGKRTLARTDGGLGLGLALVKGIVELHGGSVQAASLGKGKGTEFTVRLPLDAALAPGARQEPSAVPQNGGRRVLIVEDNTDAAESLADLVRMLGHTVEVAFDGPSAIEAAKATRPDVVLCDIGLPGMDGYEVAKALRAAALDGMQLVAVSGYAQPEDVKRAIEAGFDAHMAKPCDADRIARLLS